LREGRTVLAFLLYKFAYFLATRTPERFGLWFTVACSRLKYHLSPRDRRAVLGNLRRILPEASEEELREKAIEVFVNFGKYLYEFFRLKYLKREMLGQRIFLKNIECLDEDLAKGKGVIIVTAHMGNWELGGVFLSLLGYPMVAVALPHRDRRVNNLFNRQRQRIGVKVIASQGVALRHIYDALKANSVVALVGDRDFTNTGVSMPFLGAEKMIPRGPAILTLRTGAPIVLAFVVRQPDDTHVIEFRKLPEAPQEERAIAAAYARAIEEMIRRYPTQWLMFREFWKE